VSGRVVIVTGASSGIGEATARAFGRAGDMVVLVARRAALLERLAGELPDSLVIPADLTQVDDLARVVDRTRSHFGVVDVLVNNAGAGRYDWLEHLSEDDIRSQIRINLTAPILLTRAVLPMMLRRSADQVAVAIVDLADRPRPRRVLPGIYGAAVAVNALVPSMVDAVVARATRRAQQTRRPAAT